jgi:ATP-dependent exoDNAse (exonuclease V) beta subunit
LFSTIQAFKGLESKIVVLCDIDDYSDERLMYVALSRARSKMFVLESDNAAKQRKNILLGRNT